MIILKTFSELEGSYEKKNVSFGNGWMDGIFPDCMWKWADGSGDNSGAR